MPTRQSRLNNVFYHTKFDLPELLLLAQRLRNVACTCDPRQKLLQGSFNWGMIIRFTDGVEWVFRSPRVYSQTLDKNTTQSALASEAATLKYIRQNSSIPVPTVYHYCPTKDNSVGIPFILMSKACGTPLSSFTWPVFPGEPHMMAKARRSLKLEEKEKIMRQLGSILFQLSQFRFEKVGSLYEEKGCFNLGPCLAPGFILRERNNLPNLDRGPFNTEHEYYEAVLSAYHQHIECLSMGHHFFFAPVPADREYENNDEHSAAIGLWNNYAALGSVIDNSPNRFAYFLVGHFLKGIIPHLAARPQKNKQRTNTFPLYHPDLRPGNIFVDEKFNITCIIDWAFTYSAPAPLSFSTPSLPDPNENCKDICTTAFRSGFTKSGITVDSELWKKARMAWLFTRLVNLDGLQDYHYFEELYALTYNLPDFDPPMLFKPLYAEKKDIYNTFAEDDDDPSKIAKEEEESFGSNSIEQYSLALKIKLASELSQSFVADKRLWRWILEARGRIVRKP